MHIAQRQLRYNLFFRGGGGGVQDDTLIPIFMKYITSIFQTFDMYASDVLINILSAPGLRSQRLNTLCGFHARVLHTWSSGYLKIMHLTSCLYIYDNGCGTFMCWKYICSQCFLQPCTLKIIIICIDGTKLMSWLVCIISLVALVYNESAAITWHREIQFILSICLSNHGFAYLYVIFMFW